MHIWWTLQPQRTCTLRSLTSIKDLLKLMLYLNIFKCSRSLRASNAPGFFAGGKGCSYHTQNECVLLHKSVWGMHERGHKLELTWLESPVQFSGMSQSFTASLHTTPLNSICRSAQLKDQLVGLRSFYPIRCSSDAKCCVPGNRCSRGRCYTWSLGSACTCYSRPRLVCHTPNKDTDAIFWLNLPFMVETIFGVRQ